MKRLWLLLVVSALALGCQERREKAEEKVEEKAEEKVEEMSPAPAETGKPEAVAEKPAPDDPGQRAKVAEVRDARKVLGDMAKFLPLETSLFVFADLGAVDAAELGMGLFTIPTSFDPGPMTEELGAFLEERVGLNIMKVEWLAAAAAPDPELFVFFLGGDFGELAGGIDSPGGIRVREVEGAAAYLATIPGVQGLAVLPEKGFLDVLSGVVEGKTPALAGSPGMARLESLMERSGPSGFTAAAQLTDPEFSKKVFSGLTGKLEGFVPPDGALIAAGEKILVLIHGQETSLEIVEGQIALGKAMVKAMLDQGMAGIDDAPLPQGIGLITMKHMWPVLAEQLTPKREGEFMWIEMNFPASMGMVSVVGVLSAVAIPAFIKYTRKSKSIEAVDILDQLYKGGADYYMTQRARPDGTVASCEMPAAAGPVPGAGTCCGSLGGPDADGDGRCDLDAGEWEAAFGALKVPYPGPHYYTYEIVPDRNSPNTSMVLRATGDLDCDGERSTFERYLQGEPRPGGGCDLANRTALYVEKETE